MGQWGSEHASTTKTLTPFEMAVRWLSPEAKKAMYAAAAGNLIKRKTWNGCAFNQGGVVVEDQVSSVASAARAFNMPEKSVRNFIKCWDAIKGTDEECTELLRTTIEKMGIFSPRGCVRLVNLEIYSGSEDWKREQEMEKELQGMIADGKAEFVENACAIANLLSEAVR